MKRVLPKDLSYDEKLELFIAKDMWANTSLNNKIPVVHFHDGPLGVRKPLYNEKGQYIKTQESIAYPSSEVLASSWNLDLIRRYGESIANDCIELGVDVLLAPGVNIKRLPLNGRNFEYYSEDPLLSGLYAKEFINGVQSMHIGTSLKHFCCNNSEISRNYKSMDIDERTLNEIYLLPFSIACEASPWTVMTSYNKVNGVKMCQHEKLITKLREEYKYHGLIISDWNAVFNSVEALNAGLDMEFPFNKEHLQFLTNNKNQINENRLNNACDRILNLCYKNEEEKSLRKITLTQKERRNIALNIAEEGIVLLKNKNNILPLNKNQKLFGVGRAFYKYSCGGGSSKVIPTKTVLLQDAFKEQGCEIKVSTSIIPRLGNIILGDIENDINYIIKNNIDVSIISVGQDESVVFEDTNRQTIKLTNEEEFAIKEIAKYSKHTVVVVTGGGCIEMTNWIDDVDAVIYTGFPGEEGMNGLTNILLGKVNPSGHLAETFPLHESDYLSSKSYDDFKSSVYEEKLMVGYRQFVSEEQSVLFPFGYGLSYSDFEFDDLNVTQDGTSINVRFNVTNTSDVDGKCVPQLYVALPKGNIIHPKYELKGFSKIFVPSKKIVKGIIEVPLKYLQYYNVENHKWDISSGEYLFMLGTSSIDIKLTKTISIQVDKKEY